jgi:hypothetical protein
VQIRNVGATTDSGNPVIGIISVINQNLLG